MTENEKLPAEAEDFLRQLRSGLGRLPQDEREDILREVRSHLRDRQGSGTARLLDGFEDAQTYASRFVSEAALRGALAQGTSVELGRALLTGAKSGLFMLLTVVPIAAAQLAGGLLVISGVLKPFMPSHIGLFVDPRGGFLALGAYAGGVRAAHEVLGFWAVPLFITTGVALLWLGNRALRLLAKRKLAAARRGS